MRLIDADELINELHIEDGGTPLIAFQTNSLYKIINNQPTAYDINSVVEKLKKESYQEFCDSERIVDLKDAIEIIKAGGKNDD